MAQAIEMGEELDSEALTTGAHLSPSTLKNIWKHQRETQSQLVVKTETLKDKEAELALVNEKL